MSEDQALELKRQLSGILERLCRIETKLGERCEARGRMIESLRDRVRELEINQAKVIGGAVFLSVALGYILKGLGLE